MAETSERNPGSPAVSRLPVTLDAGAARWLAPLAVVISLLAAALSVWALIKAPAAEKPAAAGGDSKATVCTAVEKVVAAVKLQTNTDLGPEPVQRMAVAGNARLALLGGGQYLLSRIPAGTPPELAGPVRTFATSLEQIGMNYLAGVPDSDQVQANLQADSQTDSAKILAMCR